MRLATPANSGGRGAGTETLQRANRMPREKGTAPARQIAPAPANSEWPHVERKTFLRIMHLHNFHLLWTTVPLFKNKHVVSFIYASAITSHLEQRVFFFCVSYETQDV